MIDYLEPVSIRATGLSDAWFQALGSVLEKGIIYTITRGSFETKQRLEFPFITILVENPGIRPLAPWVPEGIPVPATDQAIEEYLPYLMDSYKAPNEEYTYGFYLEAQIENVIDTYRKHGFGNNQMCMNIGGPEAIVMKDPPCLRVIDTRIRDGYLHFIVYFRSWDLWGGFPTNMGGLQLLKEYMAKSIGVNDGCIIACSKGLHLYDHQWEYAKQVLRRA